ncbi:hypothetical protein C8Q78DRAFT_1081396 [Trametes maxima]|nr:hypothetical protein C8Q78DRAFT_1081396 [Trametes maxima]
MYAKAFITLALPILSAYALPPEKRDLPDINSIVSQAAGVPLSFVSALSAAGYTAPLSIGAAGVEISLATVDGTTFAEMTSIGGPAVTLAPAGVSGVVTTFGNAQVTIIPPAGATDAPQKGSDAGSSGGSSASNTQQGSDIASSTGIPASGTQKGGSASTNSGASTDTASSGSQTGGAAPNGGAGKNAAAGLVAPAMPLLTGLLSALGAVGAGALILL